MATPLRILIVEDEFVTLDTLRDTLQDLGYIVAGDAMTVSEAKEILRTCPVDIAILDINLEAPGDGIELGHFIRNQYQLPFMYLTAYANATTIREAAKSKPYGYLIKPFTPSDIYAALEVTLARAEEEQGDSQEADIFLRDGENFCRVPVQEISFVQAFRNYLEVHVGDERYLIRSTLKDFWERLPEDTFLQPHRSFLVNPEKVTGFDGASLKLAEASIPVSRSAKTEILIFFAQK